MMSTSVLSQKIKFLTHQHFQLPYMYKFSRDVHVTFADFAGRMLGFPDYCFLKSVCTIGVEQPIVTFIIISLLFL